MYYNSAVWLLVIFIIVFSLYTYNEFYLKVKRYPRGPPVLPVFGNALSISSHTSLIKTNLTSLFNIIELITQLTRTHPAYYMSSLSKTYGDLYIFWLFSKPIVIISSVDLGRDAFNQTVCSDRCEPKLESELLSNFVSGHQSFLFMPYNNEFKVLRKLSIEAIRKFLSTQNLSNITHKVVDNTVKIMIENESAIDFVPFKYIDNIFIRVFIGITFLENIEFNDSRVELMTKFFECFQKDFMTKMSAEIFPVSKLLFKTDESSKRLSNKVSEMISEFYLKSKNLKHDESMRITSLTDFHLFACEQQTKTKIFSELYLNDSNIIGNLMTLLIAGSDTTHYTFEWLLLFLAYYPDMQMKLREEICIKIGNEIPEVSDRDECHFVRAFICETLRFRNITPLSLFHTTSSDTSIGNKFIPKGTMIMLNQHSILNDSRYWTDPHIFNPQRFLDSENKFLSTKLPAFIPFGIGKRMCIGDKMAMNMLFLILTRLIQATNGKHICLSEKQTIDFEPKPLETIIAPKTYKIFLKTV